MNNITFIMPLNEFNNSVNEYIERAFDSIKNLNGCKKCKVILVGPNEVLDQAKAIYDKVGCTLAISSVENTDTNVYAQINKGVMQCTTKYFSVIEFDDCYGSYWADCAEEYLNHDASISIAIPINEEYNTEDKFIGFKNEIAWSSSFSDELGYLSIDSLETFMDFNISGAIIKTEDFISLGQLKPSLLIATWYEYLLRTIYNGKKIFIVPKVGYIHTINRKGSYTETIYPTITEDHGQWLIKTAQQEYFFKEDRHLTYGVEDKNNSVEENNEE